MALHPGEKTWLDLGGFTDGVDECVFSLVGYGAFFCSGKERREELRCLWLVMDESDSFNKES